MSYSIGENQNHDIGRLQQLDFGSKKALPSLEFDSHPFFPALVGLCRLRVQLPSCINGSASASYNDNPAAIVLQ